MTTHRETASTGIGPASSDGHKGPSLMQLYTPVFALVATLQTNKDFGDPEQLALKTLQLLKTVRETSQRNDKNPDWVTDAQYAVVAFIDESMNRSNWHGQSSWQQYPLAARLGMQLNLGELFFERLADWMRSPTRPAELLEVFYACLALGFQGKYFMNQETLANLKRQLLRDLTSSESMQGHLSPSAKSKQQVAMTVESFPWVWIFSIAGGFLLVLFTIFKLLSVSEINSLVRSLSL